MSVISFATKLLEETKLYELCISIRFAINLNLIENNVEGNEPTRA